MHSISELSIAIAAIDCELEIVKMKVDHPEFFTSATPIVPLARWNGTTAQLLEYIIPLQIDAKLAKPTGESMAFCDAVVLIRRVFGIEISSAYDRKNKTPDKEEKWHPIYRPNASST